MFGDINTYVGPYVPWPNLAPNSLIVYDQNASDFKIVVIWMNGQLSMPIGPWKFPIMDYDIYLWTTTFLLDLVWISSSGVGI